MYKRKRFSNAEYVLFTIWFACIGAIWWLLVKLHHPHAVWLAKLLGVDT